MRNLIARLMGRSPPPVEEVESEGNGYTAPHCDAAVLHAPGSCEYCDWFPSYQRYRQIARIAFTGQTPLSGEVPCPSEQRRPVERINRWPGNRAVPAPH